MNPEKTPLVSIIIPVYNGADYVREAIDSALAQTYANREIIVVNDGSTDETESICLGYGDNIRYIAKGNGGVATALNMGIAHMRGIYFLWLSHDDVYYPDMIEREMEALVSSGEPTRIVWGNFSLIDKDGAELAYDGVNAAFREELLTDSIFPLLHSFIGGCTVLIHRSHFARVGTFDEALRYTQDYEMWFRLLRGQKTIHIDRPLYKLRLHAAQGSQSEAARMRPQEAALWLDFAKKVTENEAARMFGGMHEFLRFMFIKMTIFGDGGAIDAAYEMLRGATPTTATFRSDEAVRAWLRDISGGEAGRLCVFGAGVCGKRLYYELKAIGPAVDFFADNDDKKWGAAVVEQVPCVSPEELTEMGNETTVVVGVQLPAAIVAQLARARLPYVTTMHELHEKRAAFFERFSAEG